MKTLKQICDAVLNRSALGKENSYFGSNEETLAYLANESIAELARFEWPILRKTGNITLTTDTLYDLPSDMNFIVSNSMNVQDQERMVQMPTDTTSWWYYKSHAGTGINYKVRITGSQLEVINPNAGDVIVFGYISKNLVESSAATTPDKTEFDTDSDKSVIDSELVIKDLKWRYKSEKGIEGWEKDKMMFNNYFSILKGQTNGGTSLDFGDGSEWVNPEPYTELYK